jgi:hypothetical protein
MSKQIGRIKTPYGEGALMLTKYGSNGALAVVIEPHICTVSVNLDHGQPCAQSGELPRDHFYVDTNNLSADLMRSLRESGHFAETDLPEGVSGYCTYPVWRLVERETASAATPE